MITKAGKPFATLLLAVILVIVALVLFVWTHNNNDVATVLSIAIPAIPALVAAAFAEQNKAAIHNEVITDKVKQGAAAAIDEKQGPVTAMEMQTLITILKKLDPSLDLRTVAQESSEAAQVMKDLAQTQPKVEDNGWN